MTLNRPSFSIRRKLEKAVACFRGFVRGFLRKNCGKEVPGKIAGKFARDFHEMPQIPGFRAPGEANLPRTLLGVDSARTLSPPSVRGVF